MVCGVDPVEFALAAVFGGHGSCQRSDGDHRRLHHSRLHGHGHDSWRFYVNHPRRSFGCLGKDAPSPLVRTGHWKDTSAEMKRSKWDQRIQRADELTGAHPFAADVLQFYKQIASFQKALYSYVQQAPTHQSENRASALSREDLNLRLVLPKFPEFLSHVEAVAPRPIAQ